MEESIGDHVLKRVLDRPGRIGSAFSMEFWGGTKDKWAGHFGTGSFEVVICLCDGWMCYDRYPDLLISHGGWRIAAIEIEGGR